MAVQMLDLRRRLEADPQAQPRPVGEILLDGFRRHGSARKAAGELGITPMTYTRWVEAEGGHFTRGMVIPGHGAVTVPIGASEGD